MRRWTEEARRRQSEKMKGKNRGNPGGGFRGKRHTPETKRKMSQAKMGNRLGIGHGRPPGTNQSLEWRRKMSERFKGKNNPGYIDGKGRERSGKRNQDRHNLDYKIWREAVFDRDDFICQICMKRGGDLHADHINGWVDYPELRFDLENGRTLCVSCHQAITWGKEPQGGVLRTL